MKKFFIARQGIRATLLMSAMLSACIQAQDGNSDDRRAQIQERRAEFIRNNPDAAARIEQQQARREEFLENNPEAAAQREQRRANNRERIRNNEEERPVRQAPGQRQRQSTDSVD